MVGLVLVSHSATLAEGLREMVAQVAGDDVPVGTAGGTGFVIEYRGSTFDAMSIEGRLTVANMSIEAGARLTGRAAGYGIGVMTIETDPDGESPADNYTVLRVRRDVLRTSDVGAILLSRQSTTAACHAAPTGA